MDTVTNQLVTRLVDQLSGAIETVAALQARLNEEGPTQGAERTEGSAAGAPGIGVGTLTNLAGQDQATGNGNGPSSETLSSPAAGLPSSPQGSTAPVNQATIELICHFESCKERMPDGRLRAYPDPAHGWKVPTIGWGTIRYPNGRAVKRGDVITQDQADHLFRWEVAQKADEVRSLVNVPVTEDQFGALVSFAYNVGSDIDADSVPEGLGDSTLLKKLNRGDYAGAADEFTKWNKAAGVILPGLVRRRMSERRLFLGVRPAIVTPDAYRSLRAK